MKIHLKYSEAFEQHSDIVDRWVKEGLKSNPKFNPENAKWSYSFAQRVEGIRGDVFAKKMITGELLDESRKEREKTVEQRVEEQLKSVIGLSISVSHAGFKREKSLNEIPKLFSDKFYENMMEVERQRASEEERVSKLTPEERDREAQEIINELSDMGGFFGFNVGPSGVSRIQPKKVSYDVDQVLDRVSRVGMNGLTDGEKAFLKEHSKRMNGK
jgi:hypothetical protein